MGNKDGHPFRQASVKYVQTVVRKTIQGRGGRYMAITERLGTTKTSNTTKHQFFGYFRKDVIPQSNIKAAGIQETQRQDSYHLYVGDWLHICGKTSERGVKNED